MKASEIRELSAEEIRARIAELEEERFRLKFRAATETLEDPLRLRLLRHDIARLHTVLRERDLAAGAPRRGRKNAAAARRAATAAGAAGAAGVTTPTGAKAKAGGATRSSRDNG
ncbi:MAG: 50S ribosomal protein L29 [Gemmatimonadaceae bacterium]